MYPMSQRNRGSQTNADSDKNSGSATLFVRNPFLKHEDLELVESMEAVRRVSLHIMPGESPMAAHHSYRTRTFGQRVNPVDPQ